MNHQLARVRRMAVLTLLVCVSALGLASSASAQSPDLNVIKTTQSSLVEANTDVIYEVVVANNSGVTTSGQVVLTDAVPPNMTFVLAAASDGWVCMTPAVGGTGTITCTFDPAIPDESVFAFTFVFHVNPGTPNDTLITNTANITNESDSNSENNSSSASVTVGEPPPPPPPPYAPRDVLISEFRLTGPGNGNLAGPVAAPDQYIELYCNRDTDCDLTGVTLRYRDPTLPPLFEEDPPGGDVILTFPQGITIPARQFLLIANFEGFSLFDYSFPDIDVAGDATFFDNEGFQIISNADEPTTLDSVGFAGGGNAGLYVEGTGLQRATGPRPAEQYAYVRKRTLISNGRPQDTDDNFSDFVLVSVTGNPHPGIVAPVLGAPGPKSTFSPITYSNSQFTGTLVEPGVQSEASPNKVRTGSGNSGTLSIRRSFTNNTGLPIDFVGFRVIDITTLNSLGDPAQLRLVTSGNAESFINSQGRSVNILGTTLEFDASCDGCEPQQPIGGGLNSSVFANLPVEPGRIEPGETIDVQFLTNVFKAGGFKFYIYVEASPITEESPVATNGSSSRARPRTAPARRFIDIRRDTGLPANKAPRPRKRPGTKEGGGPTVTTPPPAPALLPTRVVIINRETLEEPKPARRKKRVRRKSLRAVKVKAEEENKVEAPKN